MLAFFNTPHHNVAKSVRNIASAAVNPTAPEVLDKLDKACEEHVERMAAMEARGRLYRRRVIINFHGTSLYRGTGMLVSLCFNYPLLLLFAPYQRLTWALCL